MSPSTSTTGSMWILPVSGSTVSTSSNVRGAWGRGLRADAAAIAVYSGDGGVFLDGEGNWQPFLRGNWKACWPQQPRGRYFLLTVL